MIMMMDMISAIMVITSITKITVQTKEMRLELAFVLKKDQAAWSFSVPLFVKMLRQWNPERMLEGEIGGAKRPVQT